MLARVVGQKIGELLGQTVIVVNKPGAQGAIASDYVARQPADGYTLMLGYIGTHGINPAMQKLNYDPVKDFTPIGMVADSPTIMVVSTRIPVKDVAALVKYGHEHPDGLNYASAGLAPRRRWPANCSIKPPAPPCWTCRTKARRRR